MGKNIDFTSHKFITINCTEIEAEVENSYYDNVVEDSVQV